MGCIRALGWVGWVLILAVTTSAGPSVELRVQDPGVDFAVQDLERVLRTVPTKRPIQISVDPDALGEQAYAIRTDDAVISVVGGDRVGAMYGVLELAERLALSGDASEIQPAVSEPFIAKRGIKFNIPLDVRLPSYDDTGDAAQHNIAQVWDLEFWHAYLDGLARNRYNVLSLWCKHPFPAMIKLDDFPDVAMDDVFGFAPEIRPEIHKDFHGFDLQDPVNHKLLKRMPIEEKIAFWQHVMQYAHDRGIEVYFFTWNIYVIGAEQYGIDNWSESAVDYMRECVRVFAQTYPHVKGIGVTAGEHMGQKVGERTNVQWLFDTYGRGVADVLKDDPDREIRFIFRANSITLDDVDRDFRSRYPGVVETSFKYSGPHMYTTPEPRGFGGGYGKDVERLGYRCWMNVRNDDFYVYRWGDPDFARAYLRKLATWPTPGFYIGSDGYVWGREFISKVPELSGQLENEKHWYREMIWGRLAFDPSLPRAFFERRLGQRFPELPAEALYNAWQTASQIVPVINHSYWKSADSQFQAEGCSSERGFITIRSLMDGGVSDRERQLNITAYGREVRAGNASGRTTPFQAADELARLGDATLTQVQALRETAAAPSAELTDTLGDLEAMAWMGKYYAEKIRGATSLYLHETVDNQAGHQARAVASLRRAERCWEGYAAASTPRYKPQLFARTHYMDWNAQLELVQQDTRIAQASTGRPPRAVKLFCYSRHHPEVVDELSRTLKEQGYVPQVHPSWQRNSFANYEFAILAAHEGEKIYKDFVRKGGVVPEGLDRDGYVLVEQEKFLWVIGRGGEGVAKGLQELTRRSAAGRPIFPLTAPTP